MKHSRAQTQQTAMPMPQMPVQPSSITTQPSINGNNTTFPTTSPQTTVPGAQGAAQTFPNGAVIQPGFLPNGTVNPNQLIDPNRVDTSGKFAEYQSICRSEYAFINEPIVAFSKEAEKTLIEEFKKNTSADNFSKVFEYYSQYAKITEMKSFFAQEKKILTANQLTLYEAKILFAQNKYYEAIKIINEILKEQKNELSLLAFISKCYRQVGNLFEAKAAIQDVMKFDKKNMSKYIVDLCILETLDSNHREAEQICLQASKLFPQNELPLIYLGISAREQLNYDSALNYFKSANKIKSSEFGLTCLAEVYSLKKEYQKAADAFKESAQFEPKSGRALVGVASNYFNLKQYDEALPFYAKACMLDKKTSSLMREAFKKVSDLKNPLSEKYFTEIQKCIQAK